MSKGTLWDANTFKLMKALRTRLQNPRCGCQASDGLLTELELHLRKLNRHMAKESK
jgi:hypothetical protein